MNGEHCTAWPRTVDTRDSSERIIVSRPMNFAVLRQQPPLAGNISNVLKNVYYKLFI